jgi:hypothetical protein
VVERLIVRILVAVALCVALLAFIVVPVPTDANGNPVLPAVAFGQVGLYRLEVSLIVFYGGLLLATPAWSGLIKGRLPIEISARGARFAMQVDQPADLTDAALKKLEQAVHEVEGDLTVAMAEIKRLKQEE